MFSSIFYWCDDCLGYTACDFTMMFTCIYTELFYDRGNHHEFTSLVRELARPGDLMQSESYDFEFVNVEKPYETYTGANVRLR